jgi:hypothetical protein
MGWTGSRMALEPIERFHGVAWSDAPSPTEGQLGLEADSDEFEHPMYLVLSMVLHA